MPSLDIHQTFNNVRSATSDGPPANLYGSRPFIVKMQLQNPPSEAVYSPPELLVCDRHRSITGFGPVCSCETCAVLVEECVNEGPGKVYRWARRTGEWELSVCLGRDPIPNAEW